MHFLGTCHHYQYYSYILLILHQSGVVVGPDEDAALAELVEELAIVDVEAKSLGGGIEVGPVNEERQPVGRIEGH